MKVDNSLEPAFCLHGNSHNSCLKSFLWIAFDRQVPKRPAMSKAPAAPPRAHHGRVCSVVVTHSAQVISVASHPKDCCLKLWQLGSHEFLEQIPLNKGRPGKPSCLLMRAFGALIAVCLDDGTLPVADLNSKSVVRTFQCQVPATDLAFSPDGRWLAASLCDGGLRVFDLPAARCIDSFIFAQPALGLCFSPSGAFLLTTHAKNNSIQVWANKPLGQKCFAISISIIFIHFLHDAFYSFHMRLCKCDSFCFCKSSVGVWPDSPVLSRLCSCSPALPLVCSSLFLSLLLLIQHFIHQGQYVCSCAYGCIMVHHHITHHAWVDFNKQRALFHAIFGNTGGYLVTNRNSSSCRGFSLIPHCRLLCFAQSHRFRSMSRSLGLLRAKWRSQMKR